MAEMVQIESYLSEISEIETFQYLTEDEIKRLMVLSETVCYAEGETIIRQGDVSGHFFAIVKGSVDVTLKEVGDEDVYICRIKAGDVFGETAFFTKEARTATVTSAEETVVFRIDRKNMLEFIQSNPIAGNKILMVTILSLINKLKSTNMELAFEKGTDIDFDYVDSLVQDFMNLI